MMFDAPEPKIKSNLKWYKHMELLDFLRTVGVHARVNTMISRDRCVRYILRGVYGADIP